jgi:hypothetical protein
MHHVHDANSGLADPVENQVATNRETAVTCPQFVTPPPNMGIVGQRLKVLDQQIDKSIRSNVAVLGDVRPDPQDVAPSVGG